VITHRDNTVVRATDLVNGKPRYSDHQGTETPEPIDIKFDTVDYVGDVTTHAKFGAPTLTGAWMHIHEVVDPQF